MSAQSDQKPTTTKTNKLVVECEETGGTDDNSVIFLHPNKAEELEIFRGDVIQVQGNRKNDITYLVCLTNEDCPSGSVRLNKVARKNVKVEIGDSVTISPFADIPYGKQVHVLPFIEDLKDFSGDVFDTFLKPYFLEAYRPVMQGNNFTVKSGSISVEFKVMAVNPEPCCIVAPDTLVYTEGEPLEREKEEEKEREKIGFVDIGGLSEEIKLLRELIEIPLLHPSLHQKLGFTPSRGVLLHGPSGTGKTLLGRALANEIDAFFFLVNGPEIMTKLVGESEKNLRTVFEEAKKNAPSIIFIDEIDAIATKREETVGEVEKRVISQLLCLLDGFQQKNSGVVVVGCTCQPDRLDDSLRRFGRFAEEIEIKAPNKQGRLEILRVFTKKMKTTRGVDIDYLAEKTENYVGADLEALCAYAGRACVRENINLDDLGDDEIEKNIVDSMRVSNEHFLLALKQYVPSFERTKKEEKKEEKECKN